MKYMKTNLTVNRNFNKEIILFFQKSIAIGLELSD